MLSADLLLPQNQIYNFLRSLTIKFSPIAEYINNNLLQRNYVVNFEDKSTWKYYINMIGQYHESDTKMYIASLDTNELILFSPETLVEHPRTLQAYNPGSVYYDRLCSLYPSQIDLIRSILFPVSSIEKALDAEDFSILSYSDGFLEEWESPKILMDLEKFLNIYRERWYFDFLDDEPYFHITTWANIWFYLAMVIMTSRIENIRTPYVHSWHIWNKLKNNGIGDYSDILDRKKSILLYQNIDYLKANAGKQSNLVILANGLLFDFGIGIYNRRVVMETDTKSSEFKLTPLLEAVKIPTDYASLAVDIPPETVESIQNQIYSLGLTKSRSAETVIEVEDRVGTTTLNNFGTKLMEIRPVAKSTPYAQSFSNFYMETLLVCIKEGYYSRKIKFQEPLTKTFLYLTPGELIALFHYASYKTIGITATVIPSEFDVYQAFSTTIKTPQKSFKIDNVEYVVRAFVDASSYLSNINYSTDIRSPAEFGVMAGRMWLQYMFHTLEDQGTTIEKKRIVLDYMRSLCHERKRETVVLVDNFTTFESWLGSEGINIQQEILNQYPSQENGISAWKNLMIGIISALIPTDYIVRAFTDLTLSQDEYDRLTQLFVDMCSYRVLFLKSSPEIPSFLIGSKFSNVYGPDHFISYDEILSIIRTQHSDHYEVNSTVPVGSGFVEHVDSSMKTDTFFKITEIFDNASNNNVIHRDLPNLITSFGTSSHINISTPIYYPDNMMNIFEP